MVLRHVGLWGELGAFTRAAPPTAQTATGVPASPLVLVAIVGVLLAAVLVVALVVLWRTQRLHADTVRLQQTLVETQQLVLSQWSETTQGQAAPALLEPQHAAADPAPPAPSLAPAHALDLLSDVEWAVLEKLMADPGYFTQHALQSFGASQATIDSLLRRGVAKLDGLGRPAVPAEVQAALRERLA